MMLVREAPSLAESRSVVVVGVPRDQQYRCLIGYPHRAWISHA